MDHISGPFGFWSDTANGDRWWQSRGRLEHLFPQVSYCRLAAFTSEGHTQLLSGGTEIGIQSALHEFGFISYIKFDVLSYENVH